MKYIFFNNHVGKWNLNTACPSCFALTPQHIISSAKDREYWASSIWVVHAQINLHYQNQVGVCLFHSIVPRDIIWDFENIADKY